MKKKGSALILSLLMLSFFLTITLTIYYVAQNRSRKSAYKVRGLRVANNLDSGAAIAHYELYIADRYISQGFPYVPETPEYEQYEDDLYGLPATTTTYTKEEMVGSEMIIVPENGKHYTGIVLNNYNEYFSAKWDVTTGSALKVATGSTITLEQAIQPWIAEDKVVDGKLVSRAWLNNTGEKIIRLWTEAAFSSKSVGGYSLVKIEGVDKDSNPLKLPLDISKLDNIIPVIAKLTYEKIISISTTEIEEEKYKITYLEEATLVRKDGEIVVLNDELKGMTVEKLN